MTRRTRDGSSGLACGGTTTVPRLTRWRGTARQPPPLAFRTTSTPDRAGRCPTPSTSESTLRHCLRSFPILAVLVAGCSAAGLELQNYGFFGANPTPDGGRLKPINVVERVQRPGDSDTVNVLEGEFRLDTARIKGERIWLVTRHTVDALGKPVLDSIWMDRYSLKTIRSVRHDSDGVTRLAFDRRSVRGERVTPDGRRRTWRGLHTAEPYGLAGIEVVLGAMPMREGAGGSLPVVEGLGDRMEWLHFQVMEQTQQPRSIRGGIVFEPVWVVQARLGSRTLHYWVDPEQRAVIKRTAVRPDGERLLVMRGPSLIRVELAPVEGLPGRRGSEALPAIGPGAPIGGPIAADATP